MLEQENKNNLAAEDIFADVDGAVEPITTMMTDVEQTLPPVIMDQQPVHRRLVWLGGLAIALAIIVIGYYSYIKWFNSTTGTPATIIESVNELNASASISTSTTPQPIINKQEVLDTDRDGLSDEEEKLLGTNINEPDTDGDGLYDREEVKVYKTNPLNPDTDGDGFVDGQEVNSGYNPNGPGKLFDFNIEQK
jgi:hypothetical protein